MALYAFENSASFRRAKECVFPHSVGGSLLFLLGIVREAPGGIWGGDIRED